VPADRLSELPRLHHYRVIFLHVNPRPLAARLAVHVESVPLEEIEQALSRHQQPALGGLQRALNVELQVLDGALLGDPDQAGRTLIELLREEMAAAVRVSDAT